MSRKVTFKTFSEFLRNDGYTEKEIKHLFGTIKGLDRETRSWFIDWFDGKGFPKKQVEGVTVEFLVQKLNLKPINAFIIIDWLKNDPQSAKYFMLKVPTEVTIGEETIEEMKQFLKSKNYKGKTETDTTGEISD